MKLASVHGASPPMRASPPAVTTRSHLLLRLRRCRAVGKDSSERQAALIRQQSLESPSKPPPPGADVVGAGEAPAAAAVTLAPGLAGRLAVSEPDRQWITVVGLSALVALICSVDRAAISVAILPMSQEFGWSDTTKGAINRCARRRRMRRRAPLSSPSARAPAGKEGGGLVPVRARGAPTDSSTRALPA